MLSFSDDSGSIKSFHIFFDHRTIFSMRRHHRCRFQKNKNSYYFPRLLALLEMSFDSNLWRRQSTNVASFILSMLVNGTMFHVFIAWITKMYPASRFRTMKIGILYSLFRSPQLFQMFRDTFILSKLCQINYCNFHFWIRWFSTFCHHPFRSIYASYYLFVILNTPSLITQNLFWHPLNCP